MNKIRNDDDQCVPETVIAVGASAGGLDQIVTLVSNLPPHFRGSLIVANHRNPYAPNRLAHILNRWASVHVHEPEDNESLECSSIYVGKTSDTVRVQNGALDVTHDVSRYARMKRIDELFNSVAQSAGRNAIGIILSGMLSDGVEGLASIKAAGGYCMVQHPDEAEYRMMPDNALLRLTPDFIGTTKQISVQINELLATRQ